MMSLFYNPTLKSCVWRLRETEANPLRQLHLILIKKLTVIMNFMKLLEMFFSELADREQKLSVDKLESSEVVEMEETIAATKLDIKKVLFYCNRVQANYSE